MFLKLTKIADNPDDLEAGDTLIANLDHISAIHAERIVRKVPIVGMDNTIDGAVVTLGINGRAFPVKEPADKIWDALPDSLKITIPRP